MILEILKEASIAQHTSKEFSETLLFIFKYLPIENGLSLISPLYTKCKQEHSAHRKDRSLLSMSQNTTTTVDPAGVSLLCGSMQCHREVS